MEKLNRLIKKMIKKLVVPVLLIVLWIFLTILYIFNNNFSLSVISYSYSKNNFINFSTNRLFVGQKVTGEFKADENYLGIVTVSFSTYNQVSYADEDTLLFRIKEVGARDWYYKNTYRSGLIYEVPVYPFGFPKIASSRGKSYVFEIESLNGNKLNAVALSSWEPALVTRYQIPKSELLQNKTNLINFFSRRILVAFSDREVIFFSFIYFLPFLFYIILFTRIKQFLKPTLVRYKEEIIKYAHKTAVLRQLLIVCIGIKTIITGNLDIIIFLVVLVNIFFVPVINDIALIVIIALWFYMAKIYKNTSKVSFLVGIFLIFLCPLILFFNLNNIAEKSAVWAYMFLIVGTIQASIELKVDRKINEKA